MKKINKIRSQYMKEKVKEEARTSNKELLITHQKDGNTKIPVESEIAAELRVAGNT